MSEWPGMCLSCEAPSGRECEPTCPTARQLTTYPAQVERLIGLANQAVYEGQPQWADLYMRLARKVGEGQWL